MKQKASSERVGGCVHWHKILLGSFAASAVLLISPAAMTQESDDEGQSARSGSLLEEVTVTARRREEGLYETPMAITALTGEALKVRGIDSVNDVGRFVPNLNITRFGVGNASHAAVFIRGIGLQDHIITTDRCRV